ncbi:hypothetical protein SDC9_21724 [bioreactor metagenome]|uniref:Uncharacterized protein n=1 Tax=bioreactor metagenome TaxID=1076179 RepID=A0A644UA89_9ZZZZ|nr:hypothetical protein [Candidatus Elulimicrobiales bacterium]
MKRKKFSSIFSTKTLGIILFIVLGFFSLGIKNTEAKIVVGIKLDNKDTSVLMTATTSYKVESTYIPGGSFGAGSYSTDYIPIPSSDLLSIQNQVEEKIKKNETDNSSKYDSLFTGYKNQLDAVDSTSYPEAKKYLLEIFDQAKTIHNNSYLSIYNKMKNSAVSNNFVEGDVDGASAKLMRIYIYREINDFLTEGRTVLELEKIPQGIKDIANEIKNQTENPSGWNWLGGEDKKTLSDAEKTGAEFPYKGETFFVPTETSGGPKTNPSSPITNPSGEVMVESYETPTVCEATGLWGVMQSPNCSVAAYLVNLVLEGINSLLQGLTKLVGGIFDWVVRFSIYNFNDWVVNSNAYLVWRNVILSLVTSLLLPIVFYMLIRMLIDNDTSKIKKILPRILITALFVYFSFAIVGWIIDQTNVLSIYIYRSMHNPGETLGDALADVLAIDTRSLGAARADWGFTLFQAIKIVINGVAVLVLVQGMVLLLMRAIILLLVLIFSPLMLLPAGINEYIDKYRDMVIKSFTTSVISAPIFMFIVLIALQIGAAIRDSLQNNPQLNSLSTGMAGAGEAGNTFMGASVASAIIIVVLQLAITVSKKMSSDLGGQVAGKVGGFVGNFALGTTGAVMRRGATAVSNSDKFQGWIRKNEDGTKRVNQILAAGGRQLDRTLSTSSFDARNIGKKNPNKQALEENVQKKSELRTVQSDIAYARKKLSEKDISESDKKHWNTVLGNSEKRKGELEKDLFGDKKSQNLLQDVNQTFKDNPGTGAESMKNKEEEIKASIDKEFLKEGKGENYFSQNLEKPENEKLKTEFLNALKELNPREAYMSLSKVLADFRVSERERERLERKSKLGKEKKESSDIKEKKTSSKPEVVVVNRGGTKSTAEAPKTIQSNTVREILDNNEQQFGDEFKQANFASKKRIIEHLREKTGENTNTKTKNMTPEEPLKNAS